MEHRSARKRPQIQPGIGEPINRQSALGEGGGEAPDLCTSNTIIAQRLRVQPDSLIAFHAAAAAQSQHRLFPT